MITKALASGKSVAFLITAFLRAFRVLLQKLLSVMLGIQILPTLLKQIAAFSSEKNTPD